VIKGSATWSNASTNRLGGNFGLIGVSLRGLALTVVLIVVIVAERRRQAPGEGDLPGASAAGIAAG
jgi:hypothetical protein